MYDCRYTLKYTDGVFLPVLKIALQPVSCVVSVKAVVPITRVAVVLILLSSSPKKRFPSSPSPFGAGQQCCNVNMKSRSDCRRCDALHVFASVHSLYVQHFRTRTVSLILSPQIPEHFHGLFSSCLNALHLNLHLHRIGENLMFFGKILTAELL